MSGKKNNGPAWPGTGIGIVIVLLLAGIVLACGCTQTAPAGETTPLPVITEQAPGGETQVVSLKARSYNPEKLYIKTGTTVTWINEEDSINRRVVHMPSVPSEKVLFESDSLSPGESFSYTFTSPGRYVYADPQHGGGRSPYIEVTE